MKRCINNIPLKRSICYEYRLLLDVLLEKLSYYLKCSPAYLMGWESDDAPYYLDEKTIEIAQEIADNKELGLLFDAARSAAPEDLQTTHDMLLALKRKEQSGDEPS